MFSFIEKMKKMVENFNIYIKMYLSSSTYKSLCNYSIVGYDKAEEYYDSLLSSPKKIIAYDIETEDSGYKSEEEFNKDDDRQSTVITQIQFATDKYNAVVFPRFDTQYKDLSIAIMKLPNPKIGYNSWNFDNPIMHDNGMDFSEHNHTDAMWCYHHWQPKLPRGLQVVAGLAGFPFPWKHLFGRDMETYGGADVCSLFFILDWLPKIMKARGVWDGYIEYVYKFRNRVLYPAAKLGLPINDLERENLKVKLIGMRNSLDARLQDLIPLELRNVKQRKKVKVQVFDSVIGKEREHEYIQYGYKNPPKKILDTGRTEYDRLSGMLRERGKTPKSFEGFLASKYQLVQGRFKDFDNGTGEEVEVTKWYKFESFKASFEQLSKYINWKQVQLLEEVNRLKIETSKLRNQETKEAYEKIKEKIDTLKDLAEEYKIPKNHEGKETTSKKELEIFLDKTGDEVVQCCIEHRSLGTNINNYVPNWKPSNKDNCVHTTFGFSAASGQIDSRKPNVLNVSKHTSVGQLFRRIIETPKGYTFLEFDKKSFHVATMGYACNDAGYIRFSQLDPHSIFTSYIMPASWGKPISLDATDDEILDRCKWIKKKCKEEKEKGGARGIDLRQDQAKPTVLGNQLGLGPRKLYWMNRRSIEDEARAKYLQAVIADLFPKIEEGKRRIKRQAQKQTYLINDFGYIQHFFEVYKYVWNKKHNKWDERENDEARDALAFAVQSPAFGMIKDECNRILTKAEREIGTVIEYKSAQHPMQYQFPFRLSIHDSLIFMIRDEYADYLWNVAIEEMSKPCSKLVNEATGPEGLKVGVEGTRGRNWQTWNAETNPEGMR